MAQTVIQSNDGFTLIEALMAVLLLTVMMLMSFQGLSTINRGVANNKIRLEAIKLGQELLVDTRMIPYVINSSYTTPQIVSRQVASYDINYTVNKVIVVEVPNVSKSVTFTIQWDGGNHSYVARTLVSDKL